MLRSSQTFSLSAHSVLSLAPVGGETWIEVLRGSVWVTQENNATHHIVQAGSRVALAQSGKIVLQSLSPHATAVTVSQVTGNNRVTKPRKTASFLVSCLALLAAAAPGWTAEPQGGYAYVTIDNDLIAGSDDGYTNGFQLGFVSHALDDFAQLPMPEAIAASLEAVPIIGAVGRQRLAAMSVAQHLFTPTDLSRSEPVAGDLAYTAVLVVSSTIAAQDAHHLDALTLTLGVAGPLALGRETQESVHAITDSEMPQGWDRQTRNEFLIGLSFEHRWRLLRFGSERTNGDVITSYNASVGNLMTAANIGLGFRWGKNVPNDYFVPPPFYGESTIGAIPWDDTCRSHSSFYVAAQIDASLIGYAIHLDGNTLQDSHTVDYRPITGRAHLSLHGRVAGVAMAISLVGTTVPWDRPDGEKFELYGRLSLGIAL